MKLVSVYTQSMEEKRCFRESSFVTISKVSKTVKSCLQKLYMYLQMHLLHKFSNFLFFKLQQVR